jgi:diguanylate cyclase (GGDEF)-like protein
VDSVIRYGGEEFLVVLPDTDEQGARSFAERLRQQVAGTPVQHEGERFAMQVSLGVAVAREDEAHYEHWVSRADRALYRAKQGGRNRTELAA